MSFLPSCFLGWKARSALWVSQVRAVTPCFPFSSSFLVPQGPSWALWPPPVSFAPSSHDGLFLESFTHSHDFCGAEAPVPRVFQPRSLCVSRPHFRLPLRRQPLDTYKSQTQVTCTPPQTCSSSVLLPLKSETWTMLGHPSSLHPQQPNGHWVLERLHLEQVSSACPIHPRCHGCQPAPPTLPPPPAECFLNQAEHQVSVDIQIPSTTLEFPRARPSKMTTF